MFGRKTKRQLVQASEVITGLIETAKALASRLEETERLRSETMGLLKQSLASADGLLATAASGGNYAKRRSGQPALACLTRSSRLMGG